MAMIRVCDGCGDDLRIDNPELTFQVRVGQYDGEGNFVATGDTYEVDRPSCAQRVLVERAQAIAAAEEAEPTEPEPPDMPEDGESFDPSDPTPPPRL